MKSSFAKATIVVGCLLSASMMWSQDEIPTAVTIQNRTGEMPFSSSIGTSVEHVDLATGTLNVTIPLWSTSGRHSGDALALRWNSNMYYLAHRVNFIGQDYYIWTIQKNSGWQLNRPFWTNTSLNVPCDNPNNLHPVPSATWQTNYIFTDGSGTQYHMPLQSSSGATCSDDNDTMTNPDVGASGAFQTSAGLLRADGANLAPSAFGSPSQFKDENGNFGNLTRTGSEWPLAGTYTKTDTLGRTLYTAVTTVTNGMPTQTVFTVHDTNGSSRTITATWQVLNLTGWVTGQWYAIQSISLPNGQSYQFQYDNYGELKELDLPDGGVITYTWGTLGGSDFQSKRYVASRTETVNGVSNTWSINATRDPQITTKVTSVVTYPAIASGSGNVQNQSIFYSNYGSVTDAQIYAGAATGSPLREYSITYAVDGFVFSDHCSTVIPPPDERQYVRPTRIITVLDDGTATKKEFTYEAPVSYTYYPNHCDTHSASNAPATGSASRGNVATITEYGWGTPVGSIGVYTDVTAPLIRTTTNTYLHNQSGKGAYLTANIVDKIWSQMIQDAGGITVATTNYRYDTTSISSTGSAPAANHDYTNYPSTNTVRGNVTLVQKWLNPGNTYLTTTYTYDDLGNIISVKDPKNFTRSFSYTDSFADSSCPAVGGVADAYVTQYTDPGGHITNLKYYSCSGLKQKRQDQNDINNGRNGTTFTYDLMNRPLVTSLPDGGSTTLSYVDTANAVSVQTSKALDSARNVVSTALLDGLGRTKETQLQEDGACVIYTDTTYDALGHVASVTNPYRTCNSDALFYTKYQYDALGRKVLEIPQDATVSSNNVQTQYAGASTTVTDQTGRTHKTVTDSLGRLTQVVENPTASFGKPAYTTLYSYDVLGNLFCVEQHGSASSGTGCPSSPSGASPFDPINNQYRARWFVYDSLSRLTDAYNPETGHTNWAYDANSNVVTKTDNKNQTITYTYNNENRITGKTYSAGDAAVTYSYNQTTYNGLTITNGIDRRTGMTDASGMTAWSFDPMGREAAERRKISTVTKTNNTLYNLLGLPITLTYPNATVINYAYDTAGRVLTVTDGSRSNMSYVGASTYVSGCPMPVAAGVEYNPSGTPALYEVGADPNNPTTAGANVVTCYNKRLQISAIVAKPVNTSLPTIESLSYNWNAGTANNGTLAVLSNLQDTTLSKNFFYDAFNRISEYQSVSPSQRWDVKYTIDAWGNLTNKAPQPGYGGEMLNASPANNANQLTGYGYDLNGNMTSGDGRSYSYDSENRITTVAGVTYTYDGEGERVEKNNSKLYWGGGAGHALIESDATGTPTAEYVYFAGKIVARRDLLVGALRYYFDDHLGTSTVLSDAQGSKVVTYDYAPYGELHYQSGSDANVYQFSGKERDAETGNDYFGARYYQAAMGRFMTPDWSAVPSPVPYSELNLPQTLNLSSYVGNNPITNSDLDGHVSPNRPQPLPDSGGGALDCDSGGDCPVLRTDDPSTFGSQNTTAQIFSYVQIVEPISAGTTGDGENPVQNPHSDSQSSSDSNYKNGVPHATGALKDLLSCTQSCTGGQLTVTSTNEPLPDGKHGAETPHGKGEAADLRVPKGEEGKVLQCAANCGAKFGLNERAHPSGPGVLPHVHIQTVPGTHGGRGDLPDPEN